jgi:hypothetical protein
LGLETSQANNFPVVDGISTILIRSGTTPIRSGTILFIVRIINLYTKNSKNHKFIY